MIEVIKNKLSNAFADEKAKMDIMGLVSMAIGVMILAIVYIIMPLVGSEMDNAVTIGATSQWNSSVNSDIQTGYGLWGSVGGIIKVAAIILVVAGFLKTLMGLRSE